MIVVSEFMLVSNILISKWRHLFCRFSKLLLSDDEIITHIFWKNVMGITFHNELLSSNVLKIKWKLPKIFLLLLKIEHLNKRLDWNYFTGAK